MRHETGEQAAAVGAAHDVFDVVFRMRHHAEYVAALVDDAGDRMRRAVDIGLVVDNAFRRAIAVQHPALTLPPLKCFFIPSVIPPAMGGGNADDLTGIVAGGD